MGKFKSVTKSITRQKLTGARRASRGRWLFPARLHTNAKCKNSHLFQGYIYGMVI